MSTWCGSESRNRNRNLLFFVPSLLTPSLYLIVGQITSQTVGIGPLNTVAVEDWRLSWDLGRVHWATT
jgi:hypothetical protein